MTTNGRRSASIKCRSIIGADIGAVAAAAQLLVNAPFAILAVVTAAVVAGLPVLLDYKRYARVLKWMALAVPAK